MSQRKFTRTRKQPSKGMRRFNTFTRKAGTALQVAGSALAIAKGVAQLINVEFKTKDTVGTQAVPSTGVVIPLSLIGEGSDSDDRDGRQIKLKSIAMNMYGEHNTAGKPAQLVRYIIFLDTQQNGTLPTVSDYLQTLSIISHKNHNNRKRWLTLKDKIMMVSDNQEASRVKYYREMNHHLDYLGATASQADQGNNNLYMLLITNEPSINYPDMVYNCRIRYVDN